jgi:hypothetical protein
MISVSPKLVTAVMLAYQCHSPIKYAREMYSRDTAALIWAEFIRCVRRYRPELLEGKFERPANVVSSFIDPLKGCVSNRRPGLSEFFIRGTEPPLCDNP